MFGLQSPKRIGDRRSVNIDVWRDVRYGFAVVSRWPSSKATPERRGADLFGDHAAGLASA